MTDFDALLKRSFAEAHEPVDDGFAAHIGRAVARRESAGKVRQGVQAGAMMIAGAAVLYGGYALASAFGQQMLAMVGLEVAQANIALANAPSMADGAEGVLQSLGAGFTQILLVTAVLAGGAVLYRANQD